MNTAECTDYGQWWFAKGDYDSFRFELASVCDQVILPQHRDALSLIPGESLPTFRIGQAYIGISHGIVPAIGCEEIVIEALVVRNGFQGQGYGLKALAAIAEAAYEANVEPVLFCQPISRKMVSWVTGSGLSQDNLMAFYRRGGFRPVGSTGWLRFA